MQLVLPIETQFVKEVQIFLKRYCESLQIKGQQSYGLSKLEFLPCQSFHDRTYLFTSGLFIFYVANIYLYSKFSIIRTVPLYVMVHKVPKSFHYTRTVRSQDKMRINICTVSIIPSLFSKISNKVDYDPLRCSRFSIIPTVLLYVRTGPRKNKKFPLYVLYDLKIN